MYIFVFKLWMHIKTLHFLIVCKAVYGKVIGEVLSDSFLVHHLQLVTISTSNIHTNGSACLRPFCIYFSVNATLISGSSETLKQNIPLSVLQYFRFQINHYWAVILPMLYTVMM